MKQRVVVVVVFVVACCCCGCGSVVGGGGGGDEEGFAAIAEDVAAASFPAASWVTYAELRESQRSHSKEQRHPVTFANFTVRVPDSPSNLSVDRPQFTVFQERACPASRYWWQSAPGHVLPGDTVTFSVEQTPTGYNLLLCNSLANTSVNNTVSVPEGTVFSRLFFVMEHAPSTCDELPQSSIILEDVHVAVRGNHVPLSPSSWRIQAPVSNPCNIRTDVHKGTTIAFAWPNKHDEHHQLHALWT
ncbi:hypothetical protein PTSG_11118 [Salpingoeca rosetta]|uniref:Uncharacterized protein n=1 Tax=Salpingoeca rosetta (strain ATCC 50818 / BSB-021) TaxID=946362 RepID=F2US71_SALR5|nr:uncharacterized protein PTSG_11118 [Salpingoeca rosetta]EGD80476.1 hypothetical protein PTSG_11118 [Salpingoeca rosetta]|eukprot:XP_004988040.1 hypothetical protein PTSG_11118 [Salpingoeca rosetta]